MGALSVGWFDGKAAILVLVVESQNWLVHLLHAYIDTISKEGGDATPIGQRLVSFLHIVYRPWATVRLGHIQDWFESGIPESVLSAGSGRCSVDAWCTTALDTEECFGSEVDDHVHIFVADVVKFCDTVDRNNLDCVLGRFGLPGWFRHVYFEFHANVRLRFKRAAGVGEAWTGDDGISQGCPLRMVFEDMKIVEPP